MTDQEFIDTIRSGNRLAINKAIKEVYRLNFPSIKTLVLKTKGTDEDAADIFQQAIVVVYDQIKNNKFLGNSTIKTYLYAIGRNLWYKALKQQNLEVNLEYLDVLLDQVSLEEVEITVNTYEEKLTFDHLLKQLGEGCQKVLRDFYYSGMSLKEIAKRHDLANDATAKNKKYRCMVKLMQLIKDQNIEMQDLQIDKD